MANLRAMSSSQVPTMQLVETPLGLPPWLGVMPIQAPTPTMQLSVHAGLSGVTTIVPVAGGGAPNAIATTIPVNVPLRQEIQETFAEVSSTF